MSGEPDRSHAPGNGSRALDKLSREEILRALAGLDERLKADAEGTYSLLARGMLHSRLGDDRRAEEDFSRVIELEPDNAEALENRAAARSDLGDHRLAREDYDALLRLEPDNAIAIYSRGACLARLGDLAGAVADFDRSIALGREMRSPTTTGVAPTPRWATRAERWRTSTKPSPTTPENPTFHHYRGIAHRELGEFDQAVSDFDTAIRLEPLSNPSRQAKGVARLMQGKYAEATPDFDAVLDLDPDNADALSSRGVARSALGQYEEAIGDLHRSLALQPDNPVALITRALAYVALGVYDKAVEDLGAVLELEPDHTGTGPPGPLRVSSAGSSRRPSRTLTG